MYVMQINTHSPESCPDYNKETKKTLLAVMQQMEPLLAKRGIKMAGMWTDLGAHTTYVVYDTPSLDAFWAHLTEPEMMAWLAFNKVENRVVIGPEEIKAMLLGG